MPSVLDIQQLRSIVKMATTEFLHFLKEFPTIKQDWPHKTPKQKYQFIFNIARFSLDFTGLRVLSDLRIVPMTFFTGSIAIWWLILTIYTIVYFASQGRFSDGLPCTCLLGIMTSSFSAYLMCTLGQRTKMFHLMRFPGDFIFLDTKELNAYNRTCSQNLDGTFKRFLITISFVILSMAIGVIGPIYAYITTGARNTLLGIKLPFFDEASDLEFIFVNGLQFIAGTFGIIGNISIESCSALLISLNQISVSICELDVKEFAYRIEKESYQTSLKSKIILRNILMRIQDVDNHIQIHRDILYWRFLFAPFTFTYSIAMSIFCQLFLGFPAGYGVAVMSYVQLIIMCLLGNSSLDRNDGLLRAVNNIPWYLLLPDVQKMIYFKIQRLQKGSKFTIGPFEALSLETAKVLTQRVFSFLTFLKNTGFE